MYDAKKARIDELRVRFDEEIAKRSPEARKIGGEYLDALTEFVRAYNDGPAGDPKVAAMDTTGTLNRVEDHAEWAEQERHRVRGALKDIA